MGSKSQEYENVAKFAFLFKKRTSKLNSTFFYYLVHELDDTI